MFLQVFIQKRSFSKMAPHGFLSCHMEIVQPNSLATISRNSIDNPFEIRLRASHVKHFSMSACQSMTSKLKYWLWMPFFLGGLVLDLIEPLCKMSRRTDVLRARTCALGWDRHLIVAGRRHCMCMHKSIGQPSHVTIKHAHNYSKNARAKNFVRI